MRRSWSPDIASYHNLQLETFVSLPFFFNFVFPTFFCFTLLLRKSGVCMDTVFYGRVRFLSRAVPFHCGLANGSCMSRSVKGDILVCMLSFVKLIPWNLSSVCFASSVCLTRGLTHLKKRKSSLASPETGVTILVKVSTPICLTVLSLEFNV